VLHWVNNPKLLPEIMSLALPNYEKAAISEAKIVDYLLSLSHPGGRGKAIFFRHFGFSVDEWEALAEALLLHATQNEVKAVEITPFGARYVIEGELPTPVGRAPMVRAVWFIDQGSDTPRLVTAYPIPVEE
jgi:hypothetical protein